MRSNSCTWVLLLVLAVSPVRAEVFTGTSSTILVEVPVEVTVDGEPLRGLTADDFEVFDGGKRQDVTGFDVIDLKTVETRPGRPAALQLPIVARRHFLLLFDLSFSTPVGIQHAREAALALVREDLHPADLVAVGRYDKLRGAELVLSFTTDRQQVALAIEGLEAAHLLERRTDPLKLSFNTELGLGGGGGAGGGGGGRTGAAGAARSGFAEHLAELSEKARQGLYDNNRGDVSALSGSLRGLAQLMRTIDGRKHVVYLSEGFDDTLLRGATDENRRRDLNQATATGEYWKVSSDELFGSAGVANELEEVVRDFRRADCTVHSVDIGGVRAKDDQFARNAGRDGLFALADGTGGELYENTNDLGKAMQTLLEKTSVTYLLAFHPQRLKPDGGYHQLKVKLKDAPKGARVVHRPGYFAPDPKATPSALERQLTVAQQLLEGQEGGAISAEVLVLPRRLDGENAELAEILIEVDGASLIEGVKGSSLRAEVYVYAMDAAGGMSDFFSQSLTLDLDRTGDALRRNGLKYFASLRLGSGEHVVRVLVTNPQTGRSGLRIGWLTVPAEGAGAVVLVPPIFPERTEDWLLVRGARPELKTEEPANPFFYGDHVFVPALRPALSAATRSPVVLMGYGLGRKDASIELFVLDAGGQEVAEVPVGGLTAATGHDGLDRALLAFDPSALAPGEYTLLARIADPAGGEIKSAETRFRLAAPGQPTSQLLALKLSAPSTDRLAATAPSLPEGMEPESPSERGFERAYRRLLRQLSAGERNALVAEVAELIITTFEDRPERLSRLGRGELKAAQDLARRDPEALVPLLLLHHDLVLEYKRRSQPHLILHGIEMVRQLTDGYAREAGSEGAKVLAADVLSSLGGHLQEAGRSASLELFEHALVHQPGHAAALLGLAAYYEKRGGPYETAVGYLERLAAAQPEHREGRLRLGINLLRLERQSDGVARLEGLLASGEADWATSLAAQELARHHAREQRLDAAIELLRGVLERLPDDQKLHIQLAYLLDRGGETGASRRLIEKVAGVEPARQPARGRYNTWPRQNLDENRAELQRWCENRLGLLAGVFDDEPTEEMSEETP